jgi:IS1 family transposase
MRYSLPLAIEMSQIFASEEHALKYLIEKGVIPESAICSKCSGPATLRMERKVYRCASYKCRTERSCLRGTFFSGHRVQINKILEVAYYWLAKASNIQIETFTGVCDQAVTSFVRFLRQLVADMLDEIDYVIGGEGSIVEIDETKLGKRKYNRGHRVDGVWILVGVERTAERKVFMRIIEKRDSETLTNLILRHVNPGSVIITDYWKGYLRLSDHDFTHLKVNHSVTFKDELTGACTNTVEGTNNAIKMSIQPRQRTKNCEDNLWEFIWRRRNQGSLWESFIRALQEVIYE